MSILTNLSQKLTSLFSSGGVTSSTIELLSCIFQPLGEVREDYPEKAIRYILAGEDSEVVLALQAQTGMTVEGWMSSPATLTTRYVSLPSYSKAQEKMRSASKSARKTLYNTIFDKLSSAQIIRFATVLGACNPNKDIPKVETVPEWLWVLLADALYKTLNNLYSIDSKERAHWTTPKLLELLKSEEAQIDDPVATLITAMFERKGVDVWYTTNLKIAYRMEGAVAFLSQEKDAVHAIIPSLSAEAQKLFLDDFLTYEPDHVAHFSPTVVMLMASNSKEVRKLATAKLTQLDETVVIEKLTQLLESGAPKQKSFAADMIARLGESHRSLLESALANETNKTVITSIEQALARLSSVEAVGGDVPVPPPAKPLEVTTLPDSVLEILHKNYYEILEKRKQAAEREIEDNKHESTYYKSNWRQGEYKSWQKLETKLELVSKKTLAFLNGELTSQDNVEKELVQHKGVITNLPDFGIYQGLRMHTHGDRHFSVWGLTNFIKPQRLAQLELRQLAEALRTVTGKDYRSTLAESYVEPSYGEGLSKYIHSDEMVLPFFYENMDFIAEGLGLLPSRSSNRWNEFEPKYAIALLARFETVPKEYIAKLLEIALGENKALRTDAQNVLATVPNIHERAIEALGNSKQEIRITACQWLMRLNNKDAIKPLYTQLKKEKKEVVVAALLTTLESLGEDISPYLSPKVLLSDAQKGLKAKLPASLAWFEFETLPQVRWTDGSVVDEEIIRWWVVLAEKLKDPAPNALLERYLSLLDSKSRQALSLHILQSFIAQDTRAPSLEEATQYAIEEAPRQQADWQQWAKQYPNSEWYQSMANKSLETWIEELKRQRMSEYFGSAIKSKGLLALIGGAKGVDTVKLLQDYFKNHYTRTHQIKAFLTALSYNDDPVAIQMILGVSRRYRTASIQELAKELVNAIAERHGWTPDELADRTIPTAGFDDDGVLRLDYGSRQLMAYIDDKDKFVLKNEEGKVIKALPAPRQGDDEALIKETKALFTTAKKEYKQVLTMQTARLYEAMCSERTWTVSDWTEYLFSHPLMKRLITRLVWLEVDKDGKVLQSFRPSDDGSLLNLEDDEITLNTAQFVKVAHKVLVSDEEAEAWREHFKDYKVAFLFAQMVNGTPAFKQGATCFDDKKGYLTDTFTLRGVVTKLGYQRASIEDGGSFDRYYKHFDSLGLSAAITFSGSYVPEENMEAVLFELVFEQDRATTWSSDDLALSDIPPVLLAESYADYVKVSEATKGYDEQWQNKGLF